MNGLLSGLILFGSFAMRTPNDITIPKDDYEVSVGFKNDKVYFKRDWERELGENYIDDEMWYEWKPENLYFKPQYINKESHNLQYGKADIRYRRGDYSIGCYMYWRKVWKWFINWIIHSKRTNHTLSIETKLMGIARDELMSYNRFDWEEDVRLNYKLTDNITISNIFDYNDVKDVKHHKFKVESNINL